MNPAKGDKFILRGKLIGEFTGETADCLCGGNSYKARLVGMLVDTEWCAALVSLTDNGWEVNADDVSFMLAAIARNYAFASLTGNVDYDALVAAGMMSESDKAAITGEATTYNKTISMAKANLN